MNFVQQLEDCLRDLAAEARSHHPGVKEASERATLQLRTLQNRYVSAVRQASHQQTAHPTTRLFQSSDLVHPFLLAANYPNASSRLLEISFKAIRLLMEADAIVPSDALHLVRVWTIQAQVVVSYYQKHYIPAQSAWSRFNTIGSGDDDLASLSSYSSSGATTTSASRKSTTSSGWFSWGSSSTSTTATASSSSPSLEAKSLRNAVSSSSGQTGSQSSPSSAKDMEKLALDILSSLLQLLNLLPDPSVDVWTNAMALACLWWPYVPIYHRVHQASHMTLTQLLSLLIQQQPNHAELVHDTWEDLLTLATVNAMPSDTPTTTVTLHGAFSLCKRQIITSNSSTTGTTTSSSKSTAAWPPDPCLAMELLTTWWKESTCDDSLIPKTLQACMTLIQSLPLSNVERSLRILQWTLAILQSHRIQAEYIIQAREILLGILPSIAMATEKCRLHPEFGDDYLYTTPSNPRATGMQPHHGSVGDTNNNTGNATNKETYYIPLLPSTYLWRAALVTEVLYHALPLAPLCQDSAVLASLSEALSDWSRSCIVLGGFLARFG
jgi:hypothetical protein